MSITKDAMIRARITTQLKNQAESILEKLGMSATDAITMFYSQIVIHKGIPFEIRLESGDKESNYTKVKNKKHLKTMLKMK